MGGSNGVTASGSLDVRVLTATTSTEWAASMIKACQELGQGLGRFLFTDQNALARYSGDILALPWCNGRGEQGLQAERIKK